MWWITYLMLEVDMLGLIMLVVWLCNFRLGLYLTWCCLCVKWFWWRLCCLLIVACV